MVTYHSSKTKSKSTYSCKTYALVKARASKRMRAHVACSEVETQHSHKKRSSCFLWLWTQLLYIIFNQHECIILGLYLSIKWKCEFHEISILFTLTILTGKNGVHSIQYRNGWLAASDLFDMFTQSIKFYTFHYQ